MAAADSSPSNAGAQDTRIDWPWPVRWDALARPAAAQGRGASALAEDPRLAAHRTLDRLSALARDAEIGESSAPQAFVQALHKLIASAPWLVTARDASGRDRRDDAPGYTYAQRRGVTEDPHDGALDLLGVCSLLEASWRLAGTEAAGAVLELASTAMAAEQWLPGDAPARDAAFHADLALLHGNGSDALQRWLDPGAPDTAASAPERAALSADALRPAMWQQLHAWARADPSRAARPNCAMLLHQLLEEGLPAPEPSREATWTTGIEQVTVENPCDASPVLVVRGRGFGASAPRDVDLVAAVRDAVGIVVYRRVPEVLSWSDTQLRVRLGSDTVSGGIAFVDTAWLRNHHEWARGEVQRIKAAMSAAGCPYRPMPARPLTELPFEPAFSAAAQYRAGAPKIVDLAVEPFGAPARSWDSASAHLDAGRVFLLRWRALNTDAVALRGSGLAAQMLADAGVASDSVLAPNGSVQFTAPSMPAIVEFTMTAGNAAGCRAERTLRIVVTGAALQPAAITVLQGVPGGDVDVSTASGTETLSPPTGATIPLAADKRTVVRVDWWLALPQVPVGASMIVVASLEVRGGGGPWTSVTLRPNESTADEPAAVGVTLSSGPPFSSLAHYQQWVAAGNNPVTFNFVIPAEIGSGEVTLTATVKAFAPGQANWSVSAFTMARFLRRRRVIVRYRPWGWTTNLPPEQGQLPAPSDRACDIAIRDACSMLPIPDPQIVRLPGAAAERGNSTTLLEDLYAERNAGANPATTLRDEIWLVIGPAGQGGVALASMPWTAAADATGRTIAHEMCHLFAQNHLALCGVAGDDPTQFPNNGNVMVTGWDMWNNAVVRNARDIMTRTYCPEPTWMSPERWRRVFLQVGR